MNTMLLSENETKRTEVPFWRLLCFVMFCVWQMGIIYYIGPALNIDGRTPLPISPDNLTLLIVAGYVTSIFTMLALPRTVIWLSRASAAVALVSAVLLFVPFSAELLTALIYTQCFCCCYMIGFESATMVHYFSAEMVVRHLLIAYPIGYLLVAFLQSDFLTIDFSVFRIFMVVMLVLLLYFYLRMPANGGIVFVKRADRLVLPKRLLGGFLLLALLGALLGVIAPAAAAEFKHGVFCAYLGCAVGSLGLYALSKKTGRHPICFVTYLIGASAIGYLLLVVSEYLPALGLLAATLMGVGMSVCALLPLFCLHLVRQYPAKWLVPAYIGLAMLAVVLQSVLVEALRTMPVLLNLSYLAIVFVLAILFFLVEPFLLYSVRRKFDTSLAADNAPSEPTVLDTLTARESEIVSLIAGGHSNADIAKMLFLSEHTVKDHTKNIYRKLDVHSRFELTALVNHFK